MQAANVLNDVTGVLWIKKLDTSETFVPIDQPTGEFQLFGKRVQFLVIQCDGGQGEDRASALRISFFKSDGDSQEARRLALQKHNDLIQEIESSIVQAKSQYEELLERDSDDFEMIGKLAKEVKMLRTQLENLQKRQFLEYVEVHHWQSFDVKEFSKRSVLCQGVRVLFEWIPDSEMLDEFSSEASVCDMQLRKIADDIPGALSVVSLPTPFPVVVEGVVKSLSAVETKLMKSLSDVEKRALSSLDSLSRRISPFEELPLFSYTLGAATIDQCIDNHAQNKLAESLKGTSQLCKNGDHVSIYSKCFSFYGKLTINWSDDELKSNVFEIKRVANVSSDDRCWCGHASREATFKARIMIRMLKQRNIKEWISFPVVDIAGVSYHCMRYGCYQRKSKGFEFVLTLPVSERLRGDGFVFLQMDFCKNEKGEDVLEFVC
eukprot:TRINITY_DN7992_c0_g1_i1.p1 TRINITY_DN7992_c0_g1~~TRINITY_DN7992_c0_g1_i1.p1  ORF type:complete len:454 (-),score=123.67 TRINITY_DN7992_c0_g1_i1:106-1407(-)